MTPRRLTAGASALLIAGAAMVGTTGAATAQQRPAQTAQVCGSASVYPPGQTVRTQGSVTPDPARRGQRARADSGCGKFAPGQRVEVGVESAYRKLTEVTADADGRATVTFVVPTDLSNGPHDVVFTALSGQPNVVRVPFTVIGAAVAPVDTRNDALPRTGSDQLVPLTIAGVALVGIGASMVVVARRRRETGLPAGIA